MKKVSMFVMLLVAVAAGSFVWADHHEGEHKHDGKAGWFDSAHCDVCKPWDENKSLMMSTKWETHVIKNGMIMISMVPDEYKEDFEKVCTQCEANHKKIAAEGKKASMCGFCAAMDGLAEAGAKTEEVKTDFGKITLITSNDEATAKKIQDVAKKSQDETKKMIEAMSKQAS